MSARGKFLPLLWCFALPCVTAALTAQAQTYPSKALRYIIPYATGGPLDQVARAHAQHLTERLGMSVVPDNRAGASQAIAIEAAAKSPPDGHTLLMGTMSGLLFLTASRKSLPYDPFRDLASVSLLVSVPFSLVTHPSVPVTDTQDLIDYAKKNPGKLFYASAGVGSGHHLVMELFTTRAGINMVHVPFKNNPLAHTDLIANQVQVMFEGPAINPLVKSGKLRGLASSALTRARGLPDLPTLAETVLPGFNVATWFGLSVPAGTPRPIIDRLNRETGEWLRMPATQEKFAPNGFDLLPSTPEQMAERIRLEYPIWTKVMRSAGIEPE
ncbi:MAG: tripartite tricarboxylate transporter substrate binding protein [Betaproteobacteria bacterium]|nr:tripartite tricarboxylate transporter substrate binding protein [Betaproteobacteria bacterium]